MSKVLVEEFCVRNGIAEKMGDSSNKGERRSGRGKK